MKRRLEIVQEEINKLLNALEELEAAVKHVKEQVLELCNDTFSGNREDKNYVIEKILAYMIPICVAIIPDSSYRASWFHRHVCHIFDYSHVWIGRPPEYYSNKGEEIKCYEYNTGAKCIILWPQLVYHLVPM